MSVELLGELEVSVSVELALVDFLCFLCFFTEELWSVFVPELSLLPAVSVELVLPLIEPAVEPVCEEELLVVEGVCVSWVGDCVDGVVDWSVDDCATAIPAPSNAIEAAYRSLFISVCVSRE